MKMKRNPTTRTTTTKTKRRRKSTKTPSARAEVMALAFERDAGKRWRIELDGWVDASTARGRARWRAATRDAGARETCALGALRRDVVRADALEVWSGFSSNFRGVDAGEKRAARGAAKKFGSEFGSEASASAQIVGSRPRLAHGRRSSRDATNATTRREDSSGNSWMMCSRRAWWRRITRKTS